MSTDEELDAQLTEKIKRKQETERGLQIQDDMRHYEKTRAPERAREEQYRRERSPIHIVEKGVHAGGRAIGGAALGFLKGAAKASAPPRSRQPRRGGRRARYSRPLDYRSRGQREYESHIW